MRDGVPIPGVRDCGAGALVALFIKRCREQTREVTSLPLQNTDGRPFEALRVTSDTQNRYAAILLGCLEYCLLSVRNRAHLRRAKSSDVSCVDQVEMSMLAKMLELLMLGIGDGEISLISFAEQTEPFF